MGRNQEGGVLAGRLAPGNRVELHITGGPTFEGTVEEAKSTSQGAYMVLDGGFCITIDLVAVHITGPAGYAFSAGPVRRSEYYLEPRPGLHKLFCVV
jgi:protein involved in polysaccharide export with SLBB domain